MTLFEIRFQLRSWFDWCPMARVSRRRNPFASYGMLTLVWLWFWVELQVRTGKPVTTDVIQL